MSIRKVQLGLEAATAQGTAVAATVIYRAPAGDIVDARTQQRPPENIGYFQKLGRAYTSALGATYNMPEHEATFEQFPYTLNSGISTTSASVDGGVGATGYIYAYAMPSTAENTISTYTIEGRNTTEPVRMEYAFVSEFELNGVPSEAWKLTSMWKGRQVTGNAYTSIATIQACSELLFNQSKLYIDAATATIGTTQKTGTFLGASIKVVTGWDWLYTGDGQLYPTRPKFYPELMSVTGNITFEFDATATGEEVFWKANTPRQIRIIVQGPALATAGTEYTYKTMIFDAAILWTAFSELESRDGNDVVTMDFEAHYNADAALYNEWIVVNELSALA